MDQQQLVNIRRSDGARDEIPQLPLIEQEMSSFVSGSEDQMPLIWRASGAGERERGNDEATLRVLSEWVLLSNL